MIAPNSEESPRTWRKTTASETDAEEEKSIPVSGKYKVHPAETPSAEEIATTRIWIANTDNQNARLFSRGVAKSIAPYPCGT